MEIYNIKNENGDSAANQFIILGYVFEGVKGRMFQSYESMIAFEPYGKDTVYLDCNKWDCTTSTGKYRNIFLNETKKETEKKIKNGTYILKDLNKKEA